MSPPRAGRAALNLALWVGGVTCLARVGIVFLLEHLLRGAEPIFTWWRIAQDVPFIALHAWLAAFLAVNAALYARRGSAWRLIPVVAAAFLLQSALSGWPWAEADQIPTIRTSRGQLAIAVTSGLALATTLGIWFLLRRVERKEPVPSRIGSLPVTLGGLVVALLAPAAIHLGFGRAPESRTVDVVVHELAFEPERWEILEAREDAPPKAVAMTPSTDYREDGGDLPALTLAPPCAVAIEVPEGSGSMVLKGRTGVDLSAEQALEGAFEPVTVQVTVEVDGTVVAQHRHVLSGARGESAGRLWRDLAAGHGIPVVPGQRIVLRSEVVSPVDLDPAIVMPVGIGDLVLEKRVSRLHLASSPDRPNVVLIVMDTLRRDRLSCYGNELETTPNIDALARRGLLFEDAYATSSWTWPSTASILTGLHPETHGVLQDGECYLHHSIETLGELLAARNFATGAISCNPLIVPNKNFDQGFEHFDHEYYFRNSQEVISEIRDWIRMQAGSRFFLFLQLADPHESYDPIPEAVAKVGGVRPPDYPEEGLNAWQAPLLAGEGFDESGRLDVDRVIPPPHQEWMQRAYDAAVISADHFVGIVIDELRAQGLDDRTIVAFTSDHGEELLDHGLVTHGSTLYPELMRVPLILAGPGVPEGRRVDGPVSNRHLAPTLAAVGNAVFSAEWNPLDLSEPDDLSPAPVFFSTRQGWWNGRHRLDLYGIRLGRWELHWAPGGSEWGSEEVPTGGQFRLYDVEADPEARVDLIAGQHDLVLEHMRRRDAPGADDEPAAMAALLLHRLRAHLNLTRKGRPQRTVGAGKRDRHGLRDLGYTGNDEEREERRRRKPR